MDGLTKKSSVRLIIYLTLRDFFLPGKPPVLHKGHRKSNVLKPFH